MTSTIKIDVDSKTYTAILGDRKTGKTEKIIVGDFHIVFYETRFNNRQLDILFEDQEFKMYGK